MSVAVASLYLRPTSNFMIIVDFNISIRAYPHLTRLITCYLLISYFETVQNVLYRVSLRERAV